MIDPTQEMGKIIGIGETCDSVPQIKMFEKKNLYVQEFLLTNRF